MTPSLRNPLRVSSLFLAERHTHAGAYADHARRFPRETANNLILNVLQASGNDRFLIDGFPRNEDNLQGWTKKMADKVELQFVLFFECSEQQCTERCLKRGESSGRSDDNAESLKKRFNTYINDTVGIIKHYDQEQLVKKIDASASPDEVFEHVKAAFEQQNQ